MRIAMVSTPFVEVPPRRYGGTELVIHELVEGLVDRGHEVTLFATGNSRTRAELRSHFPVPRWPPDPLPELNHVSWALRSIVEEGFDLVHAHSAAALGPGRLLPRHLPLVYTLHHDREERLSAYYRDFPDVHFVAISRDQCDREVPLPRTTIIHHGLDPSRYEWRPDPGRHVCFVGRLSRVKGPHTAVDVAAAAGVPIHLAGEAHEVDRGYSEREMRPRLEAPHVHYLGPVGPDIKVPLLRDARALLAPIVWNEPFGLILIEAMLSGCPVVAFGRGSVPELVETGVTGLVASDEQEMAEIIAPGGPLDAFDRARCRERARTRFGRDRMVEAHEELYHRTRHAGVGSISAPGGGPPAPSGFTGPRGVPEPGPIAERRRRASDETRGGDEPGPSIRTDARP